MVNLAYEKELTVADRIVIRSLERRIGRLLARAEFSQDYATVRALYDQINEMERHIVWRRHFDGTIIGENSYYTNLIARFSRIQRALGHED